jgi:hypothetical protein
MFDTLVNFIFHYGKPLTKAYQIKKENWALKINLTFKAARQLKVCRISGTHPKIYRYKIWQR